MITHSCQTTHRGYPIRHSAMTASQSKEVVVKFISTFAPFNCSAGREVRQQESQPGPGSYNLQKENEEVLRGYKGRMGVPNDGVGMFKSKCNRFLDSATPNPGPGNYDVGKVHQFKQIPRRGTHKMVEYFRNQKQKKEYIKWSSFDTGAPRRASEGNKNPSAVFASKSNRELFVKRPQSAVGLGDKINPVGEEKSKMRRRSRDGLMSAMSVKRNRLSCPVQAQASIFERQLKKEDNSCWLGPGYYHREQEQLGKPKNSHSKGEFGSNVERFTESIPYQNCSHRQVHSAMEPTRTSESTTQPFKSTEIRFKNSESDSVGPGQYNIKNDFQHLLKANVKKGSSNNFGRTSKRFFCQSHLSPGPGDYNLMTETATEARTSVKPQERLKSACSIKNLKRKEKVLLGKFYQNQLKGTEETQGDITTLEMSQD